MKICPRCQKTYADDNLNYCLEDGSVLNQQTADPLAETLFVNQPRVTQPQPQMPSMPGGQAGWNTPQQYAVQPQRKTSKTWVWVVLILGVVILLCGGGFVGFLFYAATQVENVAANLSNSSNGRPMPPTANRGTNPTTSNSTSTSSRSDLETIDLSSFVQTFSAFGITEMAGDELIMSSKQKRFYYVLVAPDDYTTQGADTRITLRNVDNAAGSLGYGLIFHSNPQPLQQDYAFLIDTKQKRYRVVHHSPQEESSVVKWTTSTAIREGAEENVLEARDLADKIELYINGTMVTSIKNVYGYAGGVPGLYAGDGVKVAFKNLEIRK